MYIPKNNFRQWFYPIFKMIFLTSLLVATTMEIATAQGGPGPANVAITEIKTGMLAPTIAYQGTIYFKEVSQLATEVEGQVVEVLFEQGDRVARGMPMVRLDAEILSKNLEVARASLRQRQTQYNQEQVRLERARVLLEDEITTPQEFDDIRFNLEALEHAISAARAETDRLALEVNRKVIRAPFDGVVVERRTEPGEWKSKGETIAVFALDNVHDVIINIPESQLNWIQAGETVNITLNNKSIPGEIIGIMPRGDVVSRTFPVRIRITDESGLLEGMSTTVQLPSGQMQEALLVPRDAVMLRDGRSIVFTVNDSTATLHEIEVLGYSGRDVGIHANGLQAGMAVIVKGHERLRPGQEVTIID